MTTNRRFMLSAVPVLIGLASISSPVWAASFDCTKAATPVEKAICENPTLSQLDEELAATFRRAVANNPQVRQQQIAWLRNTRNECRTMDCLTTAYRTQIQTLKGDREEPTLNRAQTQESPLPNSVPPINERDRQAAQNSERAQDAQPKTTVVQQPEPQQRHQPQTEEAPAPRQLSDGLRNNLFIALAIIVLALSVWCWFKFVRNRCPNCKSVHYDTRKTETDRWRGTKEVSEKHSRGRSTRHVQTTFVNVLYEFSCNDCQHQWAKERKEELGADLTWQKLFSGY